MTGKDLIRFAICVLLWSALYNAATVAAERGNPIVKLKLHNVYYLIELADTPRRRAIGLMNRPSLEPDAGMLFLYPHAGDRQIWMKNTLIPLTVAWLDDEARILRLELLSPCAVDPCPSYGAGVDTRFVLELHADAYRRFKPGDWLPALLELKQPN